MPFEMTQSETVLDRIKELKDSLPKKQRQLCNYLLSNYKSISVATVAELAQLADVGTTTVMRLAQALDYDSYGAFKKDLLSEIILRDNSSFAIIRQNFEKTRSNDALSVTCAEAIAAIQNIQTSKNIKQYESAIDLLEKAKRINILAQRSSKAAAYYLEYSLVTFLPDRIRQLSLEPDFVYDKVLTIKDDEVLFVISNWPCGSSTLEVVSTCHENGIPIILITNTSMNPISKYSDIIIDTNSASSPFLILPIITVIEAITSELGRRTAPKSTENLEKLEEILRSKKLLVW